MQGVPATGDAGQDHLDTLWRIGQAEARRTDAQGRTAKGGQDYMSWPLFSSRRQAFAVGGRVLRLRQLPAVAHGTAEIRPAEPVGFMLLRVAAGPALRGSARLPAHRILLRSSCNRENTRGRPAVPRAREIRASRRTIRSPIPDIPSPRHT